MLTGALTRLGACKDGGVTTDDLKLLALVEAIGKTLYDDLAVRAPNLEVKAMLQQNGMEELRNSHRVGEASEIPTGEPVPIPPVDAIPFYTQLDDTGGGAAR